MIFKTVPEKPSTVTHSIKLVISLVETEMCPTWSGTEKEALRENMTSVRSASRSAATSLKYI